MSDADAPKTAEARRPQAEDFDKVFELIERDSMSLRAACHSLGLHAPSTHSAIKADADLTARYEAARQMRGDTYGEQISTIGLKTLKGEYDPAAARVAIDALKWTASRMDPKGWGDKVEVENNGTLTVTVKRFTDADRSGDQ